CSGGGMNGAPDRIRTCDLWLRRPTLYPAELRVHALFCLARTTTEGQRIRPTSSSLRQQINAASQPCATSSVFPPPFPLNCLRAAYVEIFAVSVACGLALKLLYSLHFFRLQFTHVPLTAAFGGQRSIQLSYGCIRQECRRLGRRAAQAGLT